MLQIHRSCAEIMASNSKVPVNRLSRFGHLASLAGRVAGGMLAEGAKQLAQGNRPAKADLLLTPANLRRVTDQLAHLRGAAMKVGQLLSMDAGDLLPPELSAILARLRSDANPMPPKQLTAVLRAELGERWLDHFSDFSFTPLAAASIGQVHQAVHDNGRRLAVKIQYPGIQASIDSDVDNVATLLRISGLLPAGVDYQRLLQEAKLQLKQEADYRTEAAFLTRYRELLQQEPSYLLPEPIAEICTTGILGMTFVDGVAIESLVDAEPAVRDRVISLLFTLLFRELFDFQLVQTDPNFANYRYNTTTNQLVLLDFGACRNYTPAFADAYRQLLRAAMADDLQGMDQALCTIGFFSQQIDPTHRQAVLQLVLLACEPIRQAAAFDFGSSDLASRVRDGGTALSMRQNYWHTPPADALFLHRKMAGLYLLAARLRAKVDVRALLEPFVA